MVIDIIKQGIEGFFDENKSNVKIEGVFNKLFLPIVGIWNQQIVYTNKQFDTLVPNASDILGSGEECLIRIGDEQYLITKIAHNKVQILFSNKRKFIAKYCTSSSSYNKH